MIFTAIDCNGADGTGGAEIFACAATDAARLDDGGDAKRLGVGGVLEYHAYGTHRAPASAVAAADALSLHDAEVTVHPGEADLVRGLFFRGDRQYGSGRADLGALRALGPAVATLVAHLRLHQAVKIRRRTQDAVGACSHAELARRATVVEVFDAPGAERGDRYIPVRDFLVHHGCIATVNFLLLRLCHSRGCQRRSTDKESATRRVRALSRHPWALPEGLRSCVLPSVGKTVLQRRELTVINAVKTAHAPGRINAVRGNIYTRGLAIMLAYAAVLASLPVYHRTEKREPRQEAKDSADGADGIAIGASPLPGEDYDYYKSNGRNDERRETVNPHIAGVEGIAAGTFSDDGEEIVDALHNRGEQVLGDTSIGAVRRQDSDKSMEADEKSRDKKYQNPITDNPFLPGESKMLVILPAAVTSHPEAAHYILEYAHRAYHRAIYTPEDKSQEYKAGNDCEICSEDGRQKLDFGHPSEPQVHYAREVKEQEGDGNEED